MDNWKTKQKIIVQIVSVLLSIGLWLYVTNTENPIRTVEVNKIPVQLLNTNNLSDQGMALAPDQNNYVNLKVEGSSQDVYKLNKDDFKVQIDLAEYALKIGDNAIPITIVDTPSNVSVKNTSSLVVTIKIEAVTKKDLEVQSKIDVAAKVNYYVAPAQIEPESITVSGPKSLVDKVQSLVVQGQEDNVSEDIVKNYEVVALDENGYAVDGVKLSSERVQVTIKVNSGKSVPIKLNTSENQNNGVSITSMELSQDHVEIIGPENIIDSINEVYTEEVDLSKVNKNTKLNISLIVPNGVEKISVYEVTLSLTVEEHKDNTDNKTTKEVDVIFNTNGLAEGLEMTPATNTVRVVLSGDSNILNAITAENISANIDLSKITDAGQYNETPVVNMVGNVQGVTINSIGSVSITVTKKEPTQGAFEEETTTTEPDTTTNENS